MTASEVLGASRHIFAAIAALASAAGCGGSQPPIGATDAIAQNATIAPPVGRGASWMLPGTREAPVLIYASAGSNVNVYNYATHTQVGSLTGFNNPNGQCVDVGGNIFITTSIGSAGAVLEYAHGGSTPIKTFSTDGTPIGCSISPTNGDLAVVNGGATSDVQIWKHAEDGLATYANQKHCGAMSAPGYNDKGDLYAETGEGGNAYGVCKLRAGGSALVPVPFNHTIGYAGSIMWDGKYLTLTDQSYGGKHRDKRGYTTAIYRVKEARDGLALVGTTILRYGPCGTVVPQPFIVGEKNTPANNVEGTVVVGGNQACSEFSEYTTPLTYWKYPQPGLPFHYAHPATEGVTGQSVSIVP